MIFLSVGTQLPFDRLVRAIDAWCELEGTGDQVFGQIAAPGQGGHRPRHFESVDFLSPEDYSTRFRLAERIVGHAGMGSIISALSAGKPILIMPRRADLGEHRNDHQVATARKFESHPRVLSNEDEAEFSADMMELCAMPASTSDRLADFANEEMLGRIRGSILSALR